MENCYFHFQELKWSQLKLTLRPTRFTTLQTIFLFYTIEVIGGVSAIGFTTPIKGNQFVYMARLNQSISGTPTSDWFLSTPDSNPIFTAICKMLVFGNTYLFINILNISLIFLSFHYLIEIARVILGVKNRSRDHLFLITIAILGFCIYTPDLSNGLAGMGSFSPQFQPSSFDGLLFLSIYNILKFSDKPSYRFSKISVVLPCIVAVLIHPSIFLSAFIVLLAFLLMASNILERIRKTKFSFVKWLLCLAFVALPFIFKYISIENLIYSRSEVEAFDFLAYSRIPYHVIPSNFMDISESFRFTTIIVGTLIVFRSKKLNALPRIFIISMSSLFIYFSLSVIMIDKSVFFLTVPWRISGVLYPILALVVLWKILLNLTDKKPKQSQVIVFIKLTGVATFFFSQNMTKFLIIYLCIWIVRTNHFHGQRDRVSILKNKKSLGVFGITSISMLLGIMAQTSTTQTWRNNPEGFPDGAELFKLELQGIGLVPPQFDDFRVAYGLSIFVDSKALPFDGEYLAEWVKRLKIAERAQIQPEKLCSETSLSQVSWAIVPSGAPSPSCFHKRTEISHSWSLLER